LEDETVEDVSNELPSDFGISPDDIEFLAKLHQLGEKDRILIEGRIDMLLELAGNTSDSSSKQSKSQTSTNGDGREEAAAAKQQGA